MKKAFGNVLKKNLGYIIISILMSGSAGFLSVCIPFSYQFLIDNIILKGQYPLLYKYAIFILFLIIMNMTLETVGNWLTIHYVVNLDSNLKKNIIENYVTKKRKNSFSKEELLSRISEDSSNLSSTIGEYLASTITGIITYAIVIIYVLRMNVTVGLICLLSTPALGLITHCFGKKIENNTKEFRYGGEILLTLCNECIDGKRTIQLYHCWPYEFARFKTALGIYLKRKKKFLYESMLAKKAFLGISIIFPVLIMLFGASLIQHGRLTLGSLVSILSSLNYIMMPSTIVANASIAYKQCKVYYSRLDAVLREDTEDDIWVTDKKKLEKGKAISVKDLKFVYGEKVVFKNLSFDVKENEMVAVIGRNGVGKTTLMNLLVGQLRQDGGSIMCDSVAMVFQDEFLFDDSIRNNIILGQEKNDKTDDVVRSFSSGINLDKRAGKNGSNMSGGEIKLVSLMRALEQDMPILILDEATTNIDKRTQKRIYNYLKEEKGKRTILVIDHSLSFLELCDKVLWIRDGGDVVMDTYSNLKKALNLESDTFSAEKVSGGQGESL